MSYSHLTITDRIKIETYLELGLKPCQIANKLGVHKSTISRELRRCQNGYSAALAQEQYDHRAKQKGRKSRLTSKLKKEIEDGLKSSWSPEQIYGRYQLEQKPMVAFKTIYNWLYAGLIDLDLSVLRRKGKTRQPKETRGTFRIGTSIAKRPKEVRIVRPLVTGSSRYCGVFQRRKQGLFSDLSRAKNALLLSFQDTRQNSQIHVFSHRTTL